MDCDDALRYTVRVEETPHIRRLLIEVQLRRRQRGFKILIRPHRFQSKFTLGDYFPVNTCTPSHWSKQTRLETTYEMVNRKCIDGGNPQAN
jgi:hypothetical protein